MSFSVIWPFFVLIASVGFIMAAIMRFKLHPFLALILAALVAGVLARLFPDTTIANGVPVISSLADVIRLTTEGFGKTAAGIAVSIGLASIIGFCLMESGAADRVIRRFLAIFGDHELITGAAERLNQDTEVGRRVVDDEDGFGHGRRNPKSQKSKRQRTAKLQSGRCDLAVGIFLAFGIWRLGFHYM